MDHELPPDEPAIEWSTSGGLGDVGGDRTPDLVVRSDGQVEVGERFGGGKPSSGRIEPSELQSLIADAVDDHRFFDLDGDVIAAAIDDAKQRRAGTAGTEEAVAVPLGPPYADSGTSRIAIAADGRRHEVEQHGLLSASREYPEVSELADLRAIEERLLALAERVARGD